MSFKQQQKKKRRGRGSDEERWMLQVAAKQRSSNSREQRADAFLDARLQTAALSALRRRAVRARAVRVRMGAAMAFARRTLLRTMFVRWKAAAAADTDAADALRTLHLLRKGLRAFALRAAHRLRAQTAEGAALRRWRAAVCARHFAAWRRFAVAALREDPQRLCAADGFRRLTLRRRAVALWVRGAALLLERKGRSVVARGHRTLHAERAALTAWHAHAHTSARRRGALLAGFAARSAVRILRRCFERWRRWALLDAAAEKRASGHASAASLRSALRVWVLSAHAARQQRRRAELALSSRLLRSALCAWKRCVQSALLKRQSVLRATEHLRRSVVSMAVASWRTSARISRATRKKSFVVARKALSVWQQHCSNSREIARAAARTHFSRNLARGCIAVWAQCAASERAFRIDAVSRACVNSAQARMVRMRLCLLFWHQWAARRAIATKVSAAARHFRRTRTKRVSMNGFIGLIDRSLHNTETASRHRRMRLLGFVLVCWIGETRAAKKEKAQTPEALVHWCRTVQRRFFDSWRVVAASRGSRSRQQQQQKQHRHLLLLPAASRVGQRSRPAPRRLPDFGVSTGAAWTALQQRRQTSELAEVIRSIRSLESALCVVQETSPEAGSVLRAQLEKCIARKHQLEFQQ